MIPKLPRSRVIAVFAVIFCAALFLIFKSGLVSKAESQPAAFFVPSITATNNDALVVDADGDGIADPGDTVEYTVTVTNGAAAGAGNDATGMILTDTLDPNMTLVPGSVQSSPIAGNDTFSVTGNVQIQVPDGASDLLGNDIDPDTLSNAGLTASGGATSAQGGNVVINANGSFSYNPPAGFEGADSFTYTVTDLNGNTGTGTVTLNVSGMIWFVQAGAAAGGNGRLTSPFNCLTGAGCYSTSANGAGDNVFLYTGAYTGGLTLLANQKVIGQGATATLATVAGITLAPNSNALPSTGGARPTVTTVAAATSAFTLAAGNTFRGFDIGNTTAADITGASVGTFTASEMTLSGTGRALDINGGTLAATFDSITSTSSSTQGIVLQTVGGSLTATSGTAISGATTQGILVSASTLNANFGNTTIAAATNGVSLQNNPGGTRTFGTLQITNGATSFLHAVGGGTTTVTGTATITNPTGSCIDIQDSTTSVTFANVSCTASSAAGVFLDDNTGAVTFADLDIDTDTNVRAFQATAGNTGLVTTTSGTIADTGTAVAIDIVGTSAGSTTPLNMQLTSVSANGAASGIILTNTSSSGAPGGFRVLGNTSGLCGGQVTVNTVGTPATVTAPNTADCTGGVIQNTTSNGIVLTNAANVSLTRMYIHDNVGSGVAIVSSSAVSMSSCFVQDNTDTGVKGSLSSTDFSFTNGTVDNSGTGGAAQTSNIAFNNQSGGNETNLTGTFTVTGSSLTTAFTHGISVVNFAGTVSNVNVSNNSIVSTTSTATSKGTGIQFIAFGGADISQATINSNTVRNFPSDAGIMTQGGNAVEGGNSGIMGSAGTPIAITNNTIAGQSSANRIGTQGILFNVNGTGTGNFNVSGNNIQNTVGNAISNNVFGDAVVVSTISNNVVVKGDAANTLATSSIVGGVGDTGGFATNNPSWTATVSGNNLSGHDGNGILFVAREAAVSDNDFEMILKITGNTVAAPLGGNRPGIRVDAGNDAADDDDVALEISGNNTSGSSTSPGIGVRRQGTDNVAPLLNEFGIEGLSPSPANETQTQSHITTQNPLSEVGTGFDGNPSGAIVINGSNFTNVAVPFSSPVGVNEINKDQDIHNNLSFLNTNYQTPAEMLASLDSFVKPSGTAETLSKKTSAEANVEFVSTEQTATETTEKGYLSKAAAFFAEVSDKLGAAISPTVYAQKNAKEVIPVNISGETITVGSPTGFTLPAAKAVTIKFRASVNTPIPGVTQVSNQGTVSGSNFANVLTDDPAVAGAANPTVTLIDTTTVAVTSSQNPSLVGQSVTFTATLTGAPVHASGNPSGTVEFFDGATSLGAPVAVVAGAVNTATATINISTLTAGNHTITANYSGGGQFNAATGNLTGNPQVVGNTAVWDGSADTNWNTAANWATNFAPLAGNDVTIPTAGVTNNPTISATDVTVGNLTEQSGRVLTINAGRNLTVSGACTINGTLTVAGAFSCGSFSGTGTVNFTGAAAQNVPPLPYQNLTINNAAGVNLSADTTVNGVLTLTNGNVNAGANNLILGGGATVTRTSGHVIGNVRKTYNAAGSFVFPTGSANGFSPATVNVTAGTFPLSFNVRVVQGPQPLLSAPNSLQRYWQISPTGGSPTANLTLSYLQTDVLGTETAYRIVRVNGTQVISFANNPPNVVIDTTANTATINGVTAFSDWTLGALVPTAANVAVAGRVVTPEGRGVFGAEVVMVGGDGQPRTARTNSSGYYRFADVPSGATYTISVRHKRYEFAPQIHTITDEESEIVFVALP